MRVAISHTRATDKGGVERYVHELARRLIDGGHEVHYFCNRWDETADRRIRFHRIPDYVKPVRFLRVLSFDRWSEQAIRREGPFDVVHGFAQTTAQDIYRDGSGTVDDYLEFTLRTTDSWITRTVRPITPYTWALRSIERRRYAPGRMRRIVAISRRVKDQILRRYPLSPEVVEVVYSGVNLDRFTPDLVPAAREAVRAEIEVPRDAPLLLFVGSDYRRKGLGPFLEALARLPGAYGAILGRERPRRQVPYERLAQRLGVAPRTRFLGFRGDAPRLFAAASCFVFPTLYDAFGNVVLEAMATGIPTVVSAHAGGAEVVESGRTGAVVPDPEDPAALAEATRPYLDPAVAREAGSAARAEARRYSWDVHFQKVMEIYEAVASAKRREATAPVGRGGS